MIISLILIILQCWQLGSNKIKIQVNEQQILGRNSIEVYVKDTVALSSALSGPWYAIRPTLKEYDNLSSGPKSFTPVHYTITEFSTTEILSLTELKPGTYLFGKGFTDQKSITSEKPLHRKFPSIAQIVVRTDDTYIGFLTELLNLPFVIPPKLVPGYGHQTDTRVGTDCAELAIYGRRRMGSKVPYGGPKGIYDYLVPTTSIKSGTIVHFGYQVSVVYQDSGIKGVLDAEDLLIHAFEDKVSIQKFSSTSLINQPYQVFEWKEEIANNR